VIRPDSRRPSTRSCASRCRATSRIREDTRRFDGAPVEFGQQCEFFRYGPRYESGCEPFPGKAITPLHHQRVIEARPVQFNCGSATSVLRAVWIRLGPCWLMLSRSIVPIHHGRDRNATRAGSLRCGHGKANGLNQNADFTAMREIAGRAWRFGSGGPVLPCRQSLPV
jgi:hypothetical protein